MKDYFVDVYVKDILVETFRGDNAYANAVAKYGYSNGRVAYSAYTVVSHSDSTKGRDSRGRYNETH